MLASVARADDPRACTHASCTVLEPLSLVGDQHLPPGHAAEDLVEGFLRSKGGGSAREVHEQGQLRETRVRDGLVRRDDAVPEGYSRAVSLGGSRWRARERERDAHFEPSVPAPGPLAVEELVRLDDVAARLLAMVCGARGNMGSKSQRARFSRGREASGPGLTGCDADVRDPLLELAQPVCGRSRSAC